MKHKTKIAAIVISLALGAAAYAASTTNAPENDANFEVSGVRDAVAGAGRWKGLTAVYPKDAGHDFPPDVREQAYRFLDRRLR